MKPEYIDREAAHRMMVVLTKYAWRSPDGKERRVTVDADDVNFGLARIPAADVAPVVHGRWEIVIGSDGKEHMVCTECRKQQDLTGVFSYCPNCGAKMDGERSSDA